MSDTLKQLIAALEAQRAVLGDEAVERGIQALKAQLQGERSVKADDVGGSVMTDKVEAGGDVVGRDKTENHITILTEHSASAFREAFWEATPHTDLTEATEHYFRYLANSYEFLDFKGMGVSDRVPLRLPLAKMYVPLKARIEMPRGETWERKVLQVAGRDMSPEELETIGHRLSDPRPVLELLQKRRGLIVLGDPGAGKTTFLKYLALKLTLGEGEMLGLDHRLPIYLPLSAYANVLSEQPTISLEQFIGQYYESRIGVSVLAMLKAALKEGGALLLLDGLDEVQQVWQRNQVIERVLTFCMSQPEGNLFVLTSRIVGYREVRPTQYNVAECTLTDFDEEEIALFVQKWTMALERQAVAHNLIAQQQAEREQKELMQSVRHNDGVRQLASNPLLLTILAVMKRQGVVLPERRVELYEKYVETLLSHWNLRRAVKRDVNVVETLRVLAPLALWMHYTNPGFGLVKEKELVRELEAIYRLRQHETPAEATQQLLKDVRDYTNLLLERGAGQYGFMHLTFQEYLAAVAVVQKGQEGVAPIVEELGKHLGDDSWHEVSLLTIGQLGIVQQREIAASNVLERLIRQYRQPEAVILAGEAVADVWPNGVTAQCRERIIEALIATMQNTAVPAKKRVQAGQVLARVGDPRPEVMSIEGMQLCYVPTGVFWMGEGSKSHQVNIPYDYWLGRFPVTQAQFDAFVETGGYEQEAYWGEAKELGYWKQGQGFKGRWDDEWRKRPYDKISHLLLLSNHPVVGVSWYESLAFCRWLTEQLPEGWEARLPTEAEWEKGAQGGLKIPSEAVVRTFGTLRQAPRTLSSSITEARFDRLNVRFMTNEHPQRRYVWGDEPPQKDQLNIEEALIGSSNTKGCFPENLSVYGCADMGGNVFEWVQTKYNSGDGQEKIDASDKMRVLKGGCWLWNANSSRCSCRGRNLPTYRDLNFGFRVIVVASPHFPVSKAES